jgi:hypothetical protein
MGKEPIAITASGHLHNIHPLNASRTAVVDGKTTSCNHDPATHTGHTTNRLLIPPHLVCKDCPPGVANQLFTAIRSLLCCCNRAKNDSQDDFDLPSDSAEAFVNAPSHGYGSCGDGPSGSGWFNLVCIGHGYEWYGMVWYGMVWVRPDVANRGKKQICLHGQI